jgi:hypothetical protein
MKHGHWFGALNEFDYERMADAFMSMPKHPNLHECHRITGFRDRIRLDAITLYYGVAYNVNIVRTLHIKDAAQIAHHGGAAAYVAFKCAEVRY